MVTTYYHWSSGKQLSILTYFSHSYFSLLWQHTKQSWRDAVLKLPIAKLKLPAGRETQWISRHKVKYYSLAEVQYNQFCHLFSQLLGQKVALLQCTMCCNMNTAQILGFEARHRPHQKPTPHPSSQTQKLVRQSQQQECFNTNSLSQE